MKKTILTSVMLTAIASLAMSGYVSAHHPSADYNPNYDDITTLLEENSSNHIEVIDAMMEDGDLMSSTTRGADSMEAPNTASGEGANSSQTTNQSDSPVDTAPGMSNASQSGR